MRRLRLCLLWLLLVPSAAQGKGARAAVLMDIDGTQVRKQVDGHGIHPNALRLRRALSEARHLLPGYVTGRTLANADAALREGGLIAIGGAVPYGVKITQGGVEVRQANGRLWPGWGAAVAGLQWDKSKLQELLGNAITSANRKLGPGLLSFQPNAVHGPFRTGIFFAPALRQRFGEPGLRRLTTEYIVKRLAEGATVLHELEAPGHYRALGSGPLRLATVVYNSNSMPGRLNMDFVPVTSAGQPLDKLAAMQWIAPRLGLAPETIAFAGDAHNDPLLRAAQAGFSVIVVGNAPEALKVQLEAHQTKAPGKIYVAEGHDAAGVLEGLEHLGLLRAR